LVVKQSTLKAGDAQLHIVEIVVFVDASLK